MANSGAGFEYINIDSFEGGINTNDSAIDIEDNQLRIASNCVLTKKGSVSKRKGYVKYNTALVAGSTANSVVAIHRYYYGNVDKKFIVAGRSGVNNKIYYATSSSAWTEITGGSAFKSGNDIEFLTYRNVLFIADGEYWDYYTGSGTKAAVGFTSSGLTDVKPELMAISDDRIFVKDSRYPDELFYSDYDGWHDAVPTDMAFGINDSINLPLRHGDQYGITAMRNYSTNGELAIFRENEVYVLYGVGSTDYTLRLVSDNAGCVNKRAICSTEYGSLIFVGVDNVYEMSSTDANSNQVVPIGAEIKNELTSTNLKSACCVYVPELEAVVIGTGTKCFVFNVRLRAWTTWSYGMDNVIRMPSSSDLNEVVFTKPGNGYTFTMNSGKYDDGSLFKWEVETKIFDSKEFAEFKKFRSLKIVTDTNTLTPFTCTFKVNDGDYTLLKSIVINKNSAKWDKDKWDIAKWAGSTLSLTDMILDDKCNGNYFAINLSATHQFDLTLYKIAVEATIKERRRET